MKQRDFYKKRAIKYNAQNHWMKYKELRNKGNSEIRKAKSIFFCNKINDCAQSKDIGQSWKLINNLLGKNRKSNNIPQLKIDDIIISDDNLIAKSLDDFFVNIGAKLASEIESDTEINNINFHPNRQRDITFNFSEIHLEEVTQQLSNLKILKSTSVDNIPAKALKLAATIIAPSLTWIFNLSIRTGIYVNE